MAMSKNNPKKAKKLISKGDKLLEKGKAPKALKMFKKAKDLDPGNVEVYDKLIRAHEASTLDWEETDVAESVGWLMEKQQIENPSIKLVHETLEPEWKQVMEQIGMLFAAPTDEDEERVIAKIKDFGDKALYPLIYTLLQIKKGPESEESQDLKDEE